MTPEKFQAELQVLAQAVDDLAQRTLSAELECVRRSPEDATALLVARANLHQAAMGIRLVEARSRRRM